MNRIEKLILGLMLALPVAFVAFGGAAALAEDEEGEGEEYEQQLAPVPAKGGKPAAPTAAQKAVREECGSCHVPYPAKLLPAASWQKLMGDLGNHFGTDATLGDAATTKLITDFLVANAGSAQRISSTKGAAVPLRITETRWFVREHDEVRADVWKRPSIKSAANCGACHQGAADGNFGEHSIRIPKQ